MDKIVYFDYCAFLMLLVLLGSTVVRGMTKGRVNRIFLLVIGVSLLTTMADVGAVNFDRYCEGMIPIKHFFHEMYLLLHNLQVPLYACYFLALTDTWHKFVKNLFYMFLLWAPYAVEVIFILVVNRIKPVMFYYSDTEVYTRGSMFNLLYLISFGYFIYEFTFLISRKHMFNNRQYLSLISLLPLVLSAVILQWFFPQYRVEMFANALGLLFITMMVQRPEEIIDTDTGLNKLTSYVDDINRVVKGGKEIDIIMVNVTNYSALRDMLTYEGLNMLLRHVAKIFSQMNDKFHTNAMLYYLGLGKYRFVIEDKYSQQTQPLANAINDLLRNDLQFNEMEVNLLSCVCIANCPGDIKDVDSLLAFGNDLNSRYYSGSVLYAKDIFRKEHYDIMRDIDRIIEDALTNQKFEVYYQPIYSVEEKRFNSAEALLRLKDERYGFISPEIFIPAAEKSGAIHRIGRYVLEEVCKFISGDEFKGLQIDYIEVNLSVVQCMQNNLANNVIKTLEKYHVNPCQINLEITETAASYSQNTMMDNLNKLSSAGVYFSLDDFGTGYSNMRRIATMPFHIVKLDKTFTQLNQNSNQMIVLKNTIKMLKDMQMKIVVEGIETEPLVKQFSDLKCEYIQGFYYSKPIPKNDFVKFVRESLG